MTIHKCDQCYQKIANQYSAVRVIRPKQVDILHLCDLDCLAKWLAAQKKKGKK